jgi:hypothetical protein
MTSFGTAPLRRLFAGSATPPPAPSPPHALRNEVDSGWWGGRDNDNDDDDGSAMDCELAATSVAPASSGATAMLPARDRVDALDPAPILTLATLPARDRPGRCEAFTGAPPAMETLVMSTARGILRTFVLAWGRYSPDPSPAPAIAAVFVRDADAEPEPDAEALSLPARLREGPLPRSLIAVPASGPGVVLSAASSFPAPAALFRLLPLGVEFTTMDMPMPW